MHSFYRFFGILTLTLLLNGCGFQLSGGGKSTIMPFYALYVQPEIPYNSFNRALSRALNDVGVSTDASTAPAILQILSQKFSRNLISWGNAGQTTSYLLSYTVLFQLTDKQHRILLAPQKIYITRNFSITPNQLGGDLNIENDLKEEMQHDAIQQLIERLSANITHQQLPHSRQ